MNTPLAKHIPLEDSEARLRKVWLSVSERLDAQRPRRPRLWFWGLAGVVAFSAVALWLLPTRGGEVSPWTNATLETASDALHVDLPDGSRIELAAATRLKVDETEQRSVLVHLQKGRVECDVRHDPARTFAVLALGVEVRVTGTRFSVEVEETSGAVSVAVQRGSVEVRRSGAGSLSKQVAAGETWSFDPETARSDSVSSDSVSSDSVSSESVSSESAAKVPSLEPSRQHDVTSGESDAAREERDEETAEPPAEAAEQRKSPSAKALLELANEARRQGDAREAARAYERLLHEYPSDGRAGLAAFELGRLRMDRLGDATGAVEALKRAIALAPGSGFREDAMARLVYAYSSLGSSTRCQAARSDYLDRYPNGVHASKVTRTCQK